MYTLFGSYFHENCNFVFVYFLVELQRRSQQIYRSQYSTRVIYAVDLKFSLIVQCRWSSSIRFFIPYCAIGFNFIPVPSVLSRSIPIRSILLHPALFRSVRCYSSPVHLFHCNRFCFYSIAFCSHLSLIRFISFRYLFQSILFYSRLIRFILFWSILFLSIPFGFALFNSIQFNFVFHCVVFRVNPILLQFIPFWFPFYLTLLRSISSFLLIPLISSLAATKSTN